MVYSLSLFNREEWDIYIDVITIKQPVSLEEHYITYVDTDSGDTVRVSDGTGIFMEDYKTLVIEYCEFHEYNDKYRLNMFIESAIANLKSCRDECIADLTKARDFGEALGNMILKNKIKNTDFNCLCNLIRDAVDNGYVEEIDM